MGAATREVREGPLVRERKYVCADADPALAAGVLRAWAEPDANYPEGELESVYFDTPGLASWREKANGDALKRKVRVRWYRGTPGGALRAFLEVKDRIGSARDKERFAFDAPAAFLADAPLDDPAWGAFLADAAARAGFALPAPLVPTVSIRYRRLRLRCPATDSRLSVDWDVSCPRANAALLPFAGPLACPYVVCEAKSPVADAWPFGPDLVRLGFRLRSFSKYGYFLERLLEGGFR